MEFYRSVPCVSLPPSPSPFLLSDSSSSPSHPYRARRPSLSALPSQGDGVGGMVICSAPAALLSPFVTLIPTNSSILLKSNTLGNEMFAVFDPFLLFFLSSIVVVLFFVFFFFHERSCIAFRAFKPLTLSLVSPVVWPKCNTPPHVEGEPWRLLICFFFLRKAMVRVSCPGRERG